MPIFAFRALLFLSLLLIASSVNADEWNDSFSPPRPYRVLRDIAVRAGPGNSHSRLGAVSQGEVLLVSQIVNGWHQFAYHGKQGWIFKRYLRPMAAGELQEAPASGQQPPAPAPPRDQDGQDAVQKALEELESPPAIPEEMQDLPEELPDVLPEALPDEAGEAPQEEPAPAQDDAPLEPEQLPEETAPMEEPPLPSSSGPEAFESPEAHENAQGPDAALSPAEDALKDAAAPDKDGADDSEPVRAPLPLLDPAELSDCERFISLQPGVESRRASIQDTLAPGEKACFRILALEDWVLEVTLDSDDDAARFDVFSPTMGRLVSAMRAWAHPVQRSGDKQIVVYGGNAPTRFTLGIHVR